MDLIIQYRWTSMWLAYVAYLIVVVNWIGW
jgi:hypothetical protein